MTNGDLISLCEHSTCQECYKNGFDLICNKWTDEIQTEMSPSAFYDVLKFLKEDWLNSEVNV